MLFRRRMRVTTIEEDVAVEMNVPGLDVVMVENSGDVYGNGVYREQLSNELNFVLRNFNINRLDTVIYLERYGKAMRFEEYIEFASKRFEMMA